MSTHSPGEPGPPRLGRTRYGLGLIAFGVIALYFLLSEHRAHFFGALPFVLLLACPLLHLFMHRGHRHGQGHASSDARNQPASPPRDGDRS
jgi:hypothetical protein